MFKENFHLVFLYIPRARSNDLDNLQGMHGIAQTDKQTSTHTYIASYSLSSQEAGLVNIVNIFKLCIFIINISSSEAKQMHISKEYLLQYFSISSK